MKIVGTVKFPDEVVKYFKDDIRRMEIQLPDSSIVSREKFEYNGKTIDLYEMEEKGSIYTYDVNRLLFKEDWFINILKVDCLFQKEAFLEGKTQYLLKTSGGNCYKLNYNISKSSVMFTGLNINNCFADIVKLEETQEYFNMLYEQNYSVKEYTDWSRMLSIVQNY